MVFETLGQFMSKLMLFHGYVSEFNGFPAPLTKQEEDKYIDEMLAGSAAARELFTENCPGMGNRMRKISSLQRSS